MFVNSNQRLPDNIDTLESSSFKDLQLPVTFDNQDRIIDIITELYHNHLEPKKEKGGTIYQKIDPYYYGILILPDASGVCFLPASCANLRLQTKPP